MWNLDAPPGFHGLHPDVPVTFYYRHLPHWRQDGAAYFVTARLADSLPRTKLDELQEWKRIWESRHSRPFSKQAYEELAKYTMERVESWLDQGMGRCALRAEVAARQVEVSWLHFHGRQYELGCFVVMPNHVHLVIRPLQPKQFPLEKILQSVKSFTSRRIARAAPISQGLWQQESFDRIIRDEEHLWRAVQYIGRNPFTAGLCVGEYRLWMNPEWERRGWCFQKIL